MLQNLHVTYYLSCVAFYMFLVICYISHGTCLLYNKLYFKHIFRPSLAIFFLTDIFVYIPAASLGAVIIVAAGGMFSLDSIHVRILQFLMINIGFVKHIWTLRRLDIIPFLFTFLFSLHETTLGIVIGIGTHLAMILIIQFDPIRLKRYREYSVMVLTGHVLFPAAEVLFKYILLNFNNFFSR